MKITKDRFYDPEQWDEHRLILTRLGCRVVDEFDRMSDLWITYRFGKPRDHQFMVKYGEGGSSTIYFEHASYDTIKTLEELLRLPSEPALSTPSQATRRQRVTRANKRSVGTE